MYVCIHIYIHSMCIYIHMFIYWFSRLVMQMYMLRHMYMFLLFCSCLCMYACMYVCTQCHQTPQLKVDQTQLHELCNLELYTLKPRTYASIRPSILQCWISTPSRKWTIGCVFVFCSLVFDIFLFIFNSTLLQSSGFKPAAQSPSSRVKKSVKRAKPRLPSP